MSTPSAPRRRDVLGLALAASGLVGSAFGQSASGLPGLISAAFPDGQVFAPGAVADFARALAKRPYQAPSADLPDPFTNLNYERYVAIRSQPASRIWAGDDRSGFVAEPLVRGFVFTTGVLLFTVEDGVVRRVPFDRSRIDFGGIEYPPAAADLGFSGVRLSTAGSGGFEFAIIQGASFFRAIARGQTYGVTARALTLKAAETRGEEFPNIRALWLERAGAGTNALVVHALIDSESTAAAVQLTFRPGEATIVDVETTLFPRVPLEHVGLGSAGASFMFSPYVRRPTDDVRPASYEASGLSMLNGQAEWLWRPLNNPDTLQISAFQDDNPKGFGLLQRERDFAAFGDDVQRLERRPSLWVEPLGDWGPGSVQLIEIPSDAEINKNILSYWRPKTAIAAGAEASFAYRQFWCWTPPERPPLATVVGTRSGRAGANAKRRRFVVEFVGDGLGTALPDLKAACTAAPGSIARQAVFSYPDRKAVRVLFDLDFGAETACELRLVLTQAGKPISETWLYRWTP